MSESSWWHDPRAKRKRLRQEMARQRPSGTPKSMWARYQKWLAGELEEEVRQVAEREAERRTDAARPKERSNPQPSREPRPDNRPPPGLSLEERRELVRSASPAEFEKVLQAYGINPTAETLQRKNPAQTGSAQAIVDQRRKDAEAAKKKSLSELPPFDARTASREQVVERMKARGIDDPVIHQSVRPGPGESRPIDKDWRGEPVFGDPEGRRFAQVRATALARSIEENLAHSARQAADRARVDAASQKGVRLPAPKPEAVGPHGGNWPGG